MAMMTLSATAECYGKGHIDFLWIRESILSVFSAENVFQCEDFHGQLGWAAMRVREPGVVQSSQVVSA